MLKQYGLRAALIAVCALLAVSCGKVFFGSSAAPAPVMGDWQYRDNTGFYRETGHSFSNSRFSTEQTALYEQLTRELTGILNSVSPLGPAGYVDVWPHLDAQRIKALNAEYDAYNQLFSWQYENLGDYNLDGVPSTFDLLTVVRFSEPWQTAEFNDSETYEVVRDWIDSDGNSLLDGQNAQEIGYSYNRQVSGYKVLAGQSADVTSMDELGSVMRLDGQPGWPPRYELHVPPASYRFLCVQPFSSRLQPLCSYIIDLAGGLNPVQVMDAVAQGSTTVTP